MAECEKPEGLIAQPHMGRFSRLAGEAARMVGHPWAFAVAAAIIVGWAVSGKFFHFSDTWQLVINTGTTIVTFLMVFLIQNTQNREAAALHLKLDEIIRSQQGAHNALMDVESLSEEQLEALRARYEEIAERARTKLAKGMQDTGTIDLPSKPRPQQGGSA